MTITHSFVSAKADGSDATLVKPSNWNADHIIGDGTLTINASGSVATFTLSSGTLTALTLGTTVDTEAVFGHVIDLGINSYPVLEIRNTDAGSGGGQINMFVDSASPEAADDLGAFAVYGRDSAANIQHYGQIAWHISDPTSTSEDSYCDIQVWSAGSDLTALTLGGTDPLENGFGLTHYFDFGGGADPQLLLYSNSAAVGGPSLVSKHDSASPAASDAVFSLVTYGVDSAGQTTQYGYFHVDIVDPTNGSEDSSMAWVLLSGGSLLTALTLGSGAQVGSPTGGDKGAGTVNATNYYTSGVKLPAPLGASLTLYVGPGGSDSNPGTALLPFRTILGAWIYILNNIFPAGQQITIQLQNGTYDLSVLANFGFLVAPIATLAYDRILIQGDTTTPSNVTLDVKVGVGIFCGGGVQLDVRGVHFVDTAGGGIFLRAEGAGSFIGFGQCDFGAGAGIQCFAASAAEIICNATSYTISGGGAWHLYSQANGVVDVENNNITITGTPNFTGGFIQAIDGGLANYVGNTITGTATGPRFSAAAGGVVEGNSLTSIPGDSDGNVQGGTFHFVETYITRLPIAFSASPFGTAPYEGQIQAFTDSSTAVWGDVITNGGGNHVLGYYNGTNWTVMAK